MRLIRCPTGHGNVLLNRTFAARLSRAVNVLARTACKSDTSSAANPKAIGLDRSEEHTSELQSQSNLVCRLLLEKKNSVRRNESDTRSASAPRHVSRWRARIVYRVSPGFAECHGSDGLSPRCRVGKGPQLIFTL